MKTLPGRLWWHVASWWRRDWPLVFILALCVLSFGLGWYARTFSHPVQRCRAGGFMTVVREGDEFVVRCTP